MVEKDFDGEKPPRHQLKIQGEGKYNKFLVRALCRTHLQQSPVRWVSEYFLSKKQNNKENPVWFSTAVYFNRNIEGFNINLD